MMFGIQEVFSPLVGFDMAQSLARLPSPRPGSGAVQTNGGAMCNKI